MGNVRACICPASLKHFFFKSSDESNDEKAVITASLLRAQPIKKEESSISFWNLLPATGTTTTHHCHVAKISITTTLLPLTITITKLDCRAGGRRQQQQQQQPLVPGGAASHHRQQQQRRRRRRRRRRRHQQQQLCRPRAVPAAPGRRGRRQQPHVQRQQVRDPVSNQMHCALSNTSFRVVFFSPARWTCLHLPRLLLL